LSWTDDLVEGPSSASGAVLSACGRYRTLLWRAWSARRPLVFVMLNPSTADAEQNDPTIRRCIGFARREKAGGLVVVNLSPWRATSPRELGFARARGDDVLWPIKNEADIRLAASVGPVVVAWGAARRPWMEDAAAAVERVCAPARCLGKTKGGEPRHPLMVPRDTPLVAFP
jgi:hypothetical protein